MGIRGRTMLYNTLCGILMACKVILTILGKISVFLLKHTILLATKLMEFIQLKLKESDHATSSTKGEQTKQSS